MEAEKMMNRSLVISRDGSEDGDDDVPLPGFRFHPTDEELVGFYLRRKIEKIPISIELIKQIDIYKYDPWDLPKGSNVGDKEWYFFCKRGRKYRNSVRPNRVTGSGFWKATGIDRPIYSSSTTTGESEGRDCIGLKKSLVYYRGSAGKGTKTEWMMHEFRLPADHDRSTKYLETKTIAQEAEVWTLCRIFKRSTTHKKCIPDWREAYAKRNMIHEENSHTCNSVESEDWRSYKYIRFSDVPVVQQNEKKPFSVSGHVDIAKHQLVGQFSSLVPPQAPSSIISSSASCSSFMSSTLDVDESFLKPWDWEDLRSISEMELADPYFI